VAMVGFAVYLDDSNLLSGLTWRQGAAEHPWLWLVPPAFVALAIPPIHYLLRTVLAPFVVAYEKIAFRPALSRSAQLTKGRLPYTLLVSVLLMLLWLPGMAASALVGMALPADAAMVVDPPVAAFFDTFSLVLWLLAFTQYFKALGGKTKAAAGDDE